MNLYTPVNLLLPATLLLLQETRLTPSNLKWNLDTIKETIEWTEDNRIFLCVWREYSAVLELLENELNTIEKTQVEMSWKKFLFRQNDFFVCEM